jgi:hypothetical protein
MGQLVLLVVAAAWAAVLVPPLLRSRIENRPNSSVSDFRDQLSSLQRAMPARGVAMRSMGRPLAQSPLSRPAAAGRPGVRSVRTHGGTLASAASARANGTKPAARRAAEPPRAYDAAPRSRSHAERAVRAPVSSRDALKRRRANVLFVLALTVACTIFLAATTQTQAMVWVAVLAVVALFGYVCMLGQLRQRDLQRELRSRQVVEPAPARRPRPARDLAPVEREAPRELRRRPTQQRRHDWHTGPVRRQTAARRRPVDRYSHAV